MRVPVSDRIRKLASEMRGAFLIEEDTEPEERPEAEPSAGGQAPVVVTSPKKKAPAALGLDQTEQRDLGYRPRPKEKPPRRESYSPSYTREEHNQYQEEYRRQNGRRDYFPVLKKKEGQDA